MKTYCISAYRAHQVEEGALTLVSLRLRLAQVPYENQYIREVQSHGSDHREIFS